MEILINFDGGENLANKPQGGQGTNGSCYQQHGKAEEEHVSKVKKVGHNHLGSLKSTEPKDTVDKGVKGGTSSCKEGIPPPAVVLCAQLVVDQQDGDLSAGDAENEEDNQGESKDVVKLVHPQGSHDEKEFNVGGSERNDSSNRHTNHGVQESRWSGNGPSDCGSDGGE